MCPLSFSEHNTLEHSLLFQLSTLVNWYISLQRYLNNLVLKLLMERIAYESVNIITPFKLITFYLRNNILLQPRPEDLNKMYFFDQVIYILYI